MTFKWKKGDLIISDKINSINDQIYMYKEFDVINGIHTLISINYSIEIYVESTYSYKLISNILTEVILASY